MPAGKPKLGIGGDELDRSKYNWDGSKKTLFDKTMDFLTPKPKASPPPPPKTQPGAIGSVRPTVDAIRKRQKALDEIK